MFHRKWPKTALTLTAALLLSTSALPAVALADPVLSIPDDYTLDLEMVQVQSLLVSKGLYRGTANRMDDDDLAQALLTFHKAADLERTTYLMPGDLAALSAWEPHVPDIPEQPDRLEIDLERQVMHLVNDGQIVSTLPISSGNGEMYLSPRYGRWYRALTRPGNYRIYHHIPRWRIAPLGGLYKPWYFNGGIAVHGSLSVPAYPASHGCVRVTMDDAEWLAERLSIGLPVNVRDTMPPAPTPIWVPSFTDPLGMYS